MESLYTDYPSDANGVMLDNEELMRKLEVIDSEIRKMRKKVITKKGKKKKNKKKLRQLMMMWEYHHEHLKRNYYPPPFQQKSHYYPPHPYTVYQEQREPSKWEWVPKLASKVLPIVIAAAATAFFKSKSKSVVHVLPTSPAPQSYLPDRGEKK